MTTPLIASIQVEPSTPLTAEAGGWTELEGDATAHVETLCETDELWSGVARLGPCSFEYPAAHAGAILVLDGAATVTADGHSREVGAGDVVYLAPGTVSSWTVHEALREFFVAFTGFET